MRYVESRYKVFNREEIYRIYVTDSLKAIGQLNMRYFDLVNPKPTETRDEKEIIQSISEKLSALGGD